MLRAKLANISAAAHASRAAVLMIALTLSSNALAQTRAPRQASAPVAAQPSTSQSAERTAESANNSSQTSANGTQPDLSITARVTARELRFEKVPNPTVEFTGRPRRETVWEAERENLPEQVQPGVTYRNIGITLRITSVFADIDRIVAEALGEIPASDDAQPQSAAPERPAAPPATIQTAALPATTESSAPRTSAQPVAASNSSFSKASAASAAQRPRPARKGRGN